MNVNERDFKSGQNKKMTPLFKILGFLPETVIMNNEPRQKDQFPHTLGTSLKVGFH